MDDTFVKIVVDVPLVNAEFTYSVPDELRGRLAPGQRVLVPFGRRTKTGYVSELSAETEPGLKKVKPIAELVDESPLFTPRLVELLRWLAEYYACPLHAAFEAALPSGIKKNVKRKAVNVARIEAAPDVLEMLLGTLDSSSAKAKALSAALKHVRADEFSVPLATLRREAGTTDSPFRTLEKEGMLHIAREAVSLETAAEAARVHHTQRGAITLTPEQQAASKKICRAVVQPEFKVFLLHGVTGSGKTEVYLEAIAEAVARGRQAIVLVPEISLTPQTVSRFAVRFERLGLMHSQQTEAVRRETWREIAAGKVDVVVGPQSAVFAPVPDLGLIVVDEEHEPSFKNMSAPRYHARDIAVMRAKMENCPAVLGSATPDLVSYYNATEVGKYEYVRLPKRVTEQPLPQVRVVDMGTESVREGRRVFFSRELLDALHAVKRSGEQALLFLNRRGYHPFVRCKTHGDTVRCPRCSVAMTYHRNLNALVCHYCGRRIEAPFRCPECGSRDLVHSGIGTQRVEEFLATAVPGLECVRMDTDTMRGRHEYDRVLGRFRAGETDCLIGTQMIAKGLDFPNVTLVGVLAADQILDFPDFRASERTFQLLVQVGGRAGRGRRCGTVIIQTFNPDHPVIRHAASHDYEGFAAQELAARRAAGYPPFARLARFIIASPDRGEAESLARELCELARERAHECGLPLTVSPSAPSPRAMLRGRHLFHFLVKSGSAGATRELAAALGKAMHPSGGRARVTLDVDPVAMF